MKKYLIPLTILVACILCLVLMPTQAQAAEIVASGTCGAEGDNLTWSLDDEGTLTISGTGEMEDYFYDYRDHVLDGPLLMRSTAPWQRFELSITNVIIRDGVTSVGDYAYYFCINLNNISIPNSVTSIGVDAFPESTTLSYNIYDNARYLGNATNPYLVLIEPIFTDIAHCTIHEDTHIIVGCAFSGCSDLKSITIPDTVTSIGSHAFRGCTSLTSITIPDGVTSIGYSAFAGCDNLTSVVIPDSVAQIEWEAFSGCTSLTDVIYCGTEEQWNQISIGSDNTYLTNANRSYHDFIGGNCLTAGVCTICGAEKIGEHNFVGGDCVTNGICSVCGAEKIAEHNFVGGDCLTNSVCTICGVEKIGEHNVVYGICTICKKYGICGDNLTWTLDDEGTLTISGAGKMDDYEWGYRLAEDFGDGPELFFDPSIVAPWRQYASSITNVVIQEGVSSIGDYAFYECDSLTDINIPDGVTSIGEEAFGDCTNLSSVSIPDSVISIGWFAFSSYNKLVGVTYGGTPEQWNQINIAIGNEDLINAYHPHNQWSEVTTESTYTAMGDKAYVCAECGEERIFETIPAKFYGTSINLGNTLDMYFGFYTGLVDENGTVKFVREFADGTTETTEAPITAFNKNNSVYDITYTGLAAKEMCDTIHVYVYNSEGVLVGQHSDSIRSYVLRQLREKDYGAEFRTLCVDLLNYGAAAQVEFGYNADDLANKDLTDEELAEGTQTVGAYTDKQTIIGQATSYYGTAYILETQISMAMAVRADRIGADCYALVSYTDHTGAEKKDIRVEGKLNYSVYEFFLNEIVVADGRCLLTIDFYKADGTKVLTVQDSMESYTARNADVYPLAEKMLAFSDSAYNYLHRNDK